MSERDRLAADLRNADPDCFTQHGIVADRLIALGWTHAGEVERLREALDRIRDITKPLSMTMQGPRWMSGDTDIFGGGNREKVWRIADAALGEEADEKDAALAPTWVVQGLSAGDSDD